MTHKKVVGSTAALIAAVLIIIAVSDGPLRSLRARSSAVRYIYKDKSFGEDGGEVIWRSAGGGYLFHPED